MDNNSTGTVVPFNDSIYNDEVLEPVMDKGQGTRQTSWASSNDEYSGVLGERHVSSQ